MPVISYAMGRLQVLHANSKSGYAMPRTSGSGLIGSGVEFDRPPTVDAWSWPPRGRQRYLRSGSNCKFPSGPETDAGRALSEPRREIPRSANSQVRGEVLASSTITVLTPLPSMRSSSLAKPSRPRWYQPRLGGAVTGRHLFVSLVGAPTMGQSRAYHQCRWPLWAQ